LFPKWNLWAEIDLIGALLPKLETVVSNEKKGRPEERP
jgi:hypothetical protein